MAGPVDFSYREEAPAEPMPGSTTVTVLPEPASWNEADGADRTPLPDGGLQFAFGEDATGRAAGGQEAESLDADATTDEDSDPDLLAAAPRDPCAANSPKIAAFFNQHYNIVAQRAAELGIDPTLLLGLAAHESSWGGSAMANSKWNPIGAAPNGYRPMTFGSNDAAWSYWAKTFGPRVRGVGDDASQFIGNLLIDNRGVAGAVDQRGAYNSLTSPEGDEKWPDKVGNVIRSVRNRLPQWLACKAGSP